MPRLRVAANWNNVMNGVSAKTIEGPAVLLDNVFFDVAARLGRSEQGTLYTSSPQLLQFHHRAGLDELSDTATGQDVTVSGAAAGTASSSKALDRRRAFPPFSSVNGKSPDLIARPGRLRAS